MSYITHMENIVLYFLTNLSTSERIQMDSTKEKNSNIEWMRTIAIFLVVLIHFCNYYTSKTTPSFTFDYSVALLYNVFARISVPLFFMISGALSFRKDFDFSKNNRKILHMIIVLVVWNIIYWLWDYFFLDRSMTTNIVSYIFIPVKNHLWYMYAYIALLISNPLIAVLAKYMKPVYENYFIAAWLLLCGGIRTLDFVLDYAGINTQLEYAVPIIQSTYYLGYYLCGHILYKRLHDKAQPGSARATKLLSYRPAVYITVAVILLMTCFAVTSLVSVDVEHDTEKSMFGYSNILIMLPSVCIFIAMLKMDLKSNRLIETVGRFSFGVYLSHVLFYNIIYTSIDVRAMDSITALPLLSLVTLAVSILFTCLTSHMPLLKKLLY